MNIPFNRQWAMLLALAIISLLSTTTVYGGGKNKMEYLYDVKDPNTLTLTPQIYNLGVSMSISLFPVPFDNAVGTNDLRNAITVISFPEGKLDMENHFRSVFKDIQGGGTFLPVIPPDTIGFGQTRRFLLFNFKTGGHKYYRVVPSIDEAIQKIAIADARRKQFIFEIKEFDRSSEDHHDNTYFLYLMDLRGDEVKPLKKVNIGKGSIWTVAHDRVFLWYFNKKVMDVYDMNLAPVQHPLGDIIKKNIDKVNFTRLDIHPTLPFAILWGGVKDEVLVTWDSKRDKMPCSLFGDNITSAKFSLSPDGKWVTFQEGGVMDQKRTYIMPVSEKYPNYLGSPILLFDENFNPPRFGWTNNPVSFVGSRLKELYRWELTKEAQKVEEKDYPTFHDYIVAKDLEKLTREKKQGLGKK